MIDWNKILEDASWFHWSGISPALSLNVAQVCLEALKVANDKNITVSVDLNYRKKLWNYGRSPVEIIPELIEKCDIIFGDPFTAQTMLRIDIEKNLTGEGSLPKLESYRVAVNELFPKVKTIAYTMRSTSSSSQGITVYLSINDQSFETKKLELNNAIGRIGSGDAFAAGLIYGLLNYKNEYHKILNFGVAACCMKHSIPGDYNLTSVSEIGAILNHAEYLKLNR